MGAQSFFESAREASRDAERCRRQLQAMEARMHALGGGGAGERVRSTPDPHRMSARVDAYVDREAALARRMDGDYALIDAACSVLYGDESAPGLDSEASPVWADVLWWRYLDDATWRAVGSAVAYSPTQCQLFCRRALAWMDEREFRADLMRGW